MRYPLELLLPELLAIGIGGVHDLPTLSGLHDGSSAEHGHTSA